MYCPKCKMNYSDSFDECVYCEVSLVHGEIITEDNCQNNNVLNMSNEEILTKYSEYRVKLENQVGKMTDMEFINGIKSARRDSLISQYSNQSNNEYEIKPTVKCPYCQSTDTKKITNTSKALHTAVFGIWSMGRNSKNYHCNKCGSDF